MPTARHRYQVTETDDVERALEAAAKRWPGEPRSRLLLRIINAGGTAVTQSSDLVAEARRAAIDHARGAYTDAYGPDYLALLREDWPE
jgi:hypothetical protein